MVTGKFASANHGPQILLLLLCICVLRTSGFGIIGSRGKARLRYLVISSTTILPEDSYDVRKHSTLSPKAVEAMDVIHSDVIMLHGVHTVICFFFFLGLA